MINKQALLIPLTYQEGMTKIQRKSVLINRTSVTFQACAISLLALIFAINQSYFTAVVAAAALSVDTIIDIVFGK